MAPSLASATTFKEVEEILASRGFRLDDIESTVPRPAADKEAEWGPALAEHFSKTDPGEFLEGVDAFTAVTHPTHLELEILHSNRLQEEIDRTIKRLIQVKTYKTLLPVARAGVDARRLIDVSPAKAIENHNQYQNENNVELPQEVAKIAKRTGDSRAR